MNIPSLRLGFAGTPALAATVLEALLTKSPHTVEVVYTQPDRPAGRGRTPQSSPVKELTRQYQLKLLQPERASAMDPANTLSGLDVLVVVAYGMLLPAELLNRPRLGCINIHTSLLPRWRGAAPIQRAIQAGDKQTGVTIMQMDAGLDTGPLLAQRRCPINPHDTSAELHERLANLGADCLLQTLADLAQNRISAVPQNTELATYAPKISKSEARLDWSLPALVLERQIRAFNPAPVAFAEFSGIPLRIWEGEVVSPIGKQKPGEIIAAGNDGVSVATGDGALRLLRVQLPGKRSMNIEEFLHGRPGFFSSADEP